MLLTDSTVVRLHDLLSKKFPACRTNHTKAALKAHVVMISVAHDLLRIVTRRTARVRALLRDVTRLLLHEAVDPNTRRNGLLRAVETGRRSATRGAPHAENLVAE